MAEKKKQIKKTEKRPPLREKYLTELEKLLEDVPDEGLLFLIKQASILVHNAAVEEENRKKTEASEREASELLSDAAEKSERSRKKAAPISVTLEKGGFGKTYIIRFGDEGKVFGEKEIATLLRHVHDSESEEDGCRRIYAWLERSRKDVMIDAGIKTKESPALKNLYICLKEKIS